MKSIGMNQNVKLVRYVPEQMMGCRKASSRKRVVATYIPNSTQRKRQAEATAK